MSRRRRGGRRLNPQAVSRPASPSRDYPEEASRGPDSRPRDATSQGRSCAGTAAPAGEIAGDRPAGGRVGAPDRSARSTGDRSARRAPDRPGRAVWHRPELAVWPPPHWLGATALGLFILLGALVFDPRLFTGGDNAVYYLLAKALATGRGYVTLYEPGDPPHTFYPPGYPLLLTPVFWLFEGSFWAGKVLSFAAAVVAVGLAARYLRQRLEPRPASGIVFAAALALTATNSTLLAYAHWMLTEAPYLALSLGALILAESDRKGARTWVPAAILAACAYLVRNAALPLCAAVAWGVWRRQGRRAGLWTAGISLAVLCAWMVRNAVVAPEAPSYIRQLLSVDPYDPSRGTLTLASFAARAVGNLETYAFVEIPRLVWPFLPGFGGPRTLPGYVLGVLLAPLLIYGFARQAARRGPRAGEVYAVLYLGLLAAWPWYGDRFLLPLLPLLASYLALGAAELLQGSRGTARDAGARRGPAPKTSGRRRPPAGAGACRKGRERARGPDRGTAVWSRWAPVGALLAITVLATPNLWYSLSLVPGQLRVSAAQLGGDRLAGYPAAVRDYFAAASWLGRNSPPDALVVSRKPQFTYLFSGRKSVLYPFGPPDEIERAVAGSRADYMIFDLLGGSAIVYLRPYLVRYWDRWSAAHRVGEPPTIVFARRRP